MGMKKYVFFIVEGLNDKREIGAILDTPYFKEFKTKFVPEYLIPDLNGKNGKVKCGGPHSGGGDITSNCRSEASNIRKRLEELVNDALNGGLALQIRNRDVARIVHLVDTDGAFVPSNAIERSNVNYTKYYSSRIETQNVDGFIGRNKKKKDILIKLTSANQINNIPYSIYYVSCNIEDVLFEYKNTPDAKKKSSAIWFMEKCNESPEYIFETVLNPKVATNKDYVGSWEEIQHGTNSLKRSTNLNLLLMELSEELLRQ